ncbi:MAG: type II toxin-antitoxin system PemK/MazF family toxin [Nanoarchaeota archaeon]
MNKGDIVLVKFPFTDISSKKLRPALIITEESKFKDFILAFITTQFDQMEKYDMLLTADSKDFQKTGLKRESLLKLNKLTTLNKRMIVGKIGILTKELMNQVDNNLKDLFKI